MLARQFQRLMCWVAVKATCLRRGENTLQIASFHSWGRVGDQKPSSPNWIVVASPDLLSCCFVIAVVSFIVGESFSWLPPEISPCAWLSSLKSYRRSTNSGGPASGSRLRVVTRGFSDGNNLGTPSGGAPYGVRAGLPS